MLDQVGLEIIGLVVCGIVALVFGGIVVLSQPRLAAARYFFLATIGISGWSLGISAFLSHTDGESALSFVQGYYISAALIAVSMLSVAITVADGLRYRYTLYVAWLLFLALITAIVAWPELMFNEVMIGIPNTVDLNGIGYLAYSVYFLALFLLTVLILVGRSKLAKRIAARNQLKWILYAYGPAGLFGALFNLLLPAWGNYELIWAGPLSVMIFVPFAYFAIARHGLFDLRGAAVRTVAYAMTLTVLVFIYYVLGYVISELVVRSGLIGATASSPVNVALALALAFMFQPIKHFFDQLTNRAFYRGEYDQETFARQFGRIISYGTDLRLLLKEVSSHIATNLKADRVFFYITDRGVLGSVGARKTRIPADDIAALADYYQQHHVLPEVMIVDSVSSKQVFRILQSHQSYMVLPLILHSQTLGYLFIGEHRGRGYSPRDIKAVESMANELAIAVQNSISVEEVRDLNETLQVRIDEATKELRQSNRQLQRLDEAKDEFISMASHQLRTPLTSIKGYLDMVLQGDLGKVNETQRTVLSEAFLSSERMVSLINDFLNVSRLQTGKFIVERRDSDIVEALDELIQMLGVVAKQHDITFKQKIDRDLPAVAVDIDKLRQVMLNMIDNAIFYSPPGSSVAISLQKEGRKIAFSVTDSGIGVPQSEQAGLFGKFFRASNARKKRPDGTGVGLFLAKRVILAHDGEIIFDSKEGKGSTFGFRIPV
ncbi:hypothetical protein B7Y94_04800 [Candidatus Saccharibacteria bacterium 32-49-12]|nr:MAG: hypothetical protein B7Y94_04800 [Candidatus Saccharibacteria bacterium 32-49-12]